MSDHHGGTPHLSVVLATCNRLPMLRDCLDHTRRAIADSVGADDAEIIIVDGDSRDGTLEFLAAQRDLRTHVEGRRGGCCAAYNLGLRMARGHYVLWLNDDAWPLPGAFSAALELIERADMTDVGMVAFYHTHHQPWNELHGIDVPWPPADANPRSHAPAGDNPRQSERFGILHVRGRPYANFGLLRNALLRQLGWLDPEYVFCGWDPDLSLKVQVQAGLRVIGAPDALVWHAEHQDERKRDDAARLRNADNERLFRKWNLPEKDAFPDPRPEYLALLRSRGLLPAPQPVGVLG
ncbi:MAG: glycosyltransferase [Phycisphaerales bacterium]|nr:glycosyltransferase [Phycisphaerales bacterium]